MNPPAEMNFFVLAAGTKKKYRKLQNKYSKNVRRKDLLNLVATNRSSDENNIEKVVEILKNKYDNFIKSLSIQRRSRTRKYFRIMGIVMNVE
ncbi:unnamed protein product [Trichogramma brassicae]|uniref:Uncharacterized protein n=1 Tax=Trichogramma brassicae TaxID=86971 RepID=A0A6H5IY25_9HYME|nr:unnamed protein product [Trichogramma brassicae]